MKRHRMQELKRLDRQVWHTIGSGYKDSSKENIQSQYSNYKRFCKYFYLETFPADSWQLCRCAQFLAYEGKRLGTVANTISTIRTLQALKGYPTPDLFDVAVKLQLRGLKNLSEKVVKRAQAMTPQMLKSIHDKVNFTDEFEMVCFVALLVGFFLLLRKSNLIPDSMTGKKGFDGNKQLQRQDLRLGKKTILVDIKWSKTIQKSGRVLQLLLLPLMSMEVCPIHWIRHMVTRIPGKPDSPLFMVPAVKGNGYVLLTYSKLAGQLKKWAKLIKGSDEGWTLHCLCRGV